MEGCSFRCSVDESASRADCPCRMFEEVAETIDLEESLEEVERIFEEAPDICFGIA